MTTIDTISAQLGIQQWIVDMPKDALWVACA